LNDNDHRTMSAVVQAKILDGLLDRDKAEIQFINNNNKRFKNKTFKNNKSSNDDHTEGFATTVDDDEEEEEVHINSIVLEVDFGDDDDDHDDSNSGSSYVLAILSSKDRIHVETLQQVMLMDNRFMLTASNNNNDDNRPFRLVRLALAESSQRVEQLCGFAPGTIPPLFGLTPKPLVTFVEESLLRLVVVINDNDIVQNRTAAALVGGGGLPFQSCRLASLNVLLRQDNVHMASFRRQELPLEKKNTSTTATATTRTRTTALVDTKKNIVSNQQQQALFCSGTTITASGKRHAIPTTATAAATRTRTSYLCNDICNKCRY
jgi:hypothetical protein